MTQEQRILDYIDKHGEITQRDAVRLGCYRLSARVFDLRSKGIFLKCETRSVKNADGSRSNIGVYTYDRRED